MVMGTIDVLTGIVALPQRIVQWSPPLIGAIVSLLSLFASSVVRAADCPAAGQFDFRVETIHGEISRDMSIGVADMRRLAGPERAKKHYPLLGMSASTLTYAVSTRVGTSRDANGSICAFPRSVDVRIGYIDRNLFVASEIQSDRCLFEAYLDHQLRHAHADDQALDRLIPDFSRQLRSSIERIKVTPASDTASATAKLNAEIALHVKLALRTYDQAYAALQGAVDSREELTRLREVCQGRGQSQIFDRPLSPP